MNEAQLRTWLMKAPRPATMRVTCDGEVKLVAIREGQSWAAQARSVLALGPELIEGLDDKNVVLRATRFDSGDDDDLSPDATTAARAPAAPPAMVDVATLQLVSRLIADAYKHSNEVAFMRLADLFTAVTKRSENLEKSLALSERARLRDADELLERLQEGSGGEPLTLQTLMAQFLAGQQQSAVTKPPNGKA